MDIERDIECILDNRENELIKRMRGDDIKVEQLEIGDIIFRDKKTQEIILVIERKTLNDLKASICDGRSREQKARLLSNFCVTRIIYLIEGNIDVEKINGMSVDTVLCSIINTQLRDNIKVYKTLNISETVKFINKLYDKLEKDKDIYFKKEEKKFTEESYAFTLKTSKKANMTAKVWAIKMLCLIPQVTEKISSAIVDKYPTIKELLLVYESTPEDRRNALLENITYNIKNEKTRRIGIKISTRIYGFIYGLNTEPKLESVKKSKKINFKDKSEHKRLLS